MEPLQSSVRRARQRDEIVAVIAAGRLDRAADLAHEHVADFPTDLDVVERLVEALSRSPSERVRARSAEFGPTEP